MEVKSLSLAAAPDSLGTSSSYIVHTRAVCRIFFTIFGLWRIATGRKSQAQRVETGR